MRGSGWKARATAGVLADGFAGVISGWKARAACLCVFFVARAFLPEFCPNAAGVFEGLCSGWKARATVGVVGGGWSGDGEAEVHFAVSQVQQQPFLVCHASEGGVRCLHLLGRGASDRLTKRLQRFRQ